MWQVPCPLRRQTGHRSCPFNTETTGTPIPAASIVTALFFVGVIKALLDDRSCLRSGLEVVVIGISATTTTHLIGRLFDVSM